MTQHEGDVKKVDVTIHRDDVAFWGWTSGTTGFPKATVHLHHDFAYPIHIHNSHSIDITKV